MSDLVDHDIAGITRPSSPGGRPDFLSDVIVELGFAQRETVEQAVREARAGTTVSRVLVESGAVTEDQLARATAERYGLDHIDLEAFTVEAAAANMIKPAAARRYMAVPVGFAPGGALIVAVSDPADVLGLNDIAVMTKLDVVAAVAARSAIEGLVERLPLTPDRTPDGAAAANRRASATPAPRAEEVPAPPQAVFWQAGDVTEAGTTNPRAPSHVQVAGAPAREQVPVAEPQPAPVGQAPAAPAGYVVPPETPPSPPAGHAIPSAPAPAAPAAVPDPAGPSDREALYQELQAERAARAELERRAVAAERRLTEVTRSSGEGDRRLGDAQATADEARKRARELEDADRRAEHARVALAELREETDRQREQHARIERELRTRVATEERRRRELEEHLSEVEESAFAAERAFDELGLAQRRMRGALRALVEPDGIDDAGER
jgi:hypothetical protein